MQATYFDFASTKISFFSPLGRMAFASCFFLFFLPSNVSHKFNITYSFMWLDFCTSLHKYCCTFVHNYRGKERNRWAQFLLFRTSFSSKFNLLCWLLTNFSTSSFNELRQSVGWNERCYVYNNFTTNHKWLVIISSNLNLALRLLF